MFFLDNDELDNDGQDIAYTIVLVVYGNPQYAFNKLEKMAIRDKIIEAVKPELLPGQTAQVFTTKGSVI